MKLLESKYLFFNSLNRQSGSPNWNPIFYIPNGLLTKFDYRPKLLKISLFNMSLPIQFYNVQNNINNQFIWNDGVNDTTVNIPEGSYSVYDLRDWFNVQLLANYTISYDLVTNKFTFTSANPANTITPITCGEFFGLQDNVTYTGTFVSIKPVNMSWIETIYFNMDILSNTNNIDNINQEELTSSTILERIPLNTAPFDNLRYNKTINNMEVEVRVSSLSSIRCWLSTNRNSKITEIYSPWDFVLFLQIFEDE